MPGKGREEGVKELMLSLLTWISVNTPLAYDGAPLPELVRASENQLTHMSFHGELPQGTKADRSVVGVYLPEEHNVYLSNDVDLATVEGRAVLLHELVHYLQYENGLHKTAQCIAQLEQTAYAAEAKYLLQRGKQPDFDAMQVSILSMCEWDQDA